MTRRYTGWIVLFQFFNLEYSKAIQIIPINVGTNIDLYIRNNCTTAQYHVIILRKVPFGSRLAAEVVDRPGRIIRDHNGGSLVGPAFLHHEIGLKEGVLVYLDRLSCLIIHIQCAIIILLAFLWNDGRQDQITLY